MTVRRPRSSRMPSSNSPGRARPAAPPAAPVLEAPVHPVDPDATFASLGVPAPLVASLAGGGIVSPFPIQTATLPDSLAGRDVLGRGRTGSGKTVAFALPVMARLAGGVSGGRVKGPRALILAPTRELVSQIDATLRPLAAAAKLTTLTIFGGVSAGPQQSALRRGVDIVVACPGRLLDHLGQGNLTLSSVETTVLDEADHMADLGFLPMVKRILDQTPAGSQRLLFSATLDNGIDQLVRRYLHDPVVRSVDPVEAPVAEMSHHVLHVDAEHRLEILVDLAAAPGKRIFFTRTKHGAKRLTRQLVAAGVAAVELHGNLAQNARTKNLSAFANGSATTLVATDIAARGIHVDDVSLVVHADPPVEHKAYLHRSGRTARAGAEGTVITLMTDEQVSDVKTLTRKAGIRPQVTRTRPGDHILTTLAPGERTFVAPPPAPVIPERREAPRNSRRHAGHSGAAPRANRPQGGRSGRASGRTSGR